MSTTESQVILKRVYGDVAKRMAFMFTESTTREEMPKFVTKPLLAHISFDGRVQGTLALAVPSAMCPELAANTLGIGSDDPLAESRARDALKEFLNVVCGNVVLELGGPDDLFELSTPQVVSIDNEGWRKLQDDPGSVTVMVDNYPNLLRLAYQSN